MWPSGLMRVGDERTDSDAQRPERHAAHVVDARTSRTSRTARPSARRALRWCSRNSAGCLRTRNRRGQPPDAELKKRRGPPSVSRRDLGRRTQQARVEELDRVAQSIASAFHLPRASRRARGFAQRPRDEPGGQTRSGALSRLAGAHGRNPSPRRTRQRHLPFQMYGAPSCFEDPLGILNSERSRQDSSHSGVIVASSRRARTPRRFAQLLLLDFPRRGRGLT